MNINYDSLLRKFLFKMNPEWAHQCAMAALKVVQSIPMVMNRMGSRDIVSERLSSSCWGLHFANPVGLAAGFDKDACVYPVLAKMGFGFVEVGTITPLPQSGNPKPRLFRFPQNQALLNRMGFNNQGMMRVKDNFERLDRPSMPIGVNLGKNKITVNSHAVDDYCLGLHTLYPYADYFVINVSSPNTQGLRQLQEVDVLQRLLGRLLLERNQLARNHKKWCPILLKISPDLRIEHLKEMVHMIVSLGIDGIIATNTTLSKEGLCSREKEQGGVSGRPLARVSTHIIRTVYQITQNRIPIIGVGGIFTGQDAYEKIRAGANLLQIYTSFIYRGPLAAGLINEELRLLLERDGFSSIKEVVGIGS